jgi:hypothetical protein
MRDIRLAVEAVRALAARTGGSVAFSWLDDEAKRRGVTQHDLKVMAKDGLLEKDGESTRGKHRAYYRLADHPEWKNPTQGPFWPRR